MLKAEELDQVQAWHDNIGSGEYLPRETMQRVIDQAREALRLGTQLTDALKLQSKLRGDVRDYREEVERLTAEVARLRSMVDGHHPGCNYLASPVVCNKCGWTARAALTPEASHD